MTKCIQSLNKISYLFPIIFYLFSSNDIADLKNVIFVMALISFKFHKNYLSKYLLIGIYFTEKEILTHSSTLAWKIPWTEEPGRLESFGVMKIWT